MAEILIDTNVLVYAHNRSEPVKQKQAIDLLKMLQVAGGGHLSAQCLSEFFSAVTRGTVPKLTLSEAVQQADRLARVWPVLDITSQIVLEATRGVCDHQLNFWDAQIWAAARLNQIPVVFSEDFGTGTVIEGVRFVNPFSDDFDPHAWGL
jgi:predicted nucleic acid-binding protein